MSVSSAKRRSVVVVAPGDEASGGEAGAPPAKPPGEAHPGLQRLTSFVRRKSAARGRTASIHELAAAMDGLDRRILASLEALRAQNAAGLGHIRALHRTKSGRLAPGAGAPSRSASGRDLIPAASPRGLLGRCALGWTPASGTQSAGRLAPF